MISKQKQIQQQAKGKKKHKDYILHMYTEKTRKQAMVRYISYEEAHSSNEYFSTEY